MDMVPDTWHVSTTCRHVSITNSASRWATGECLGSKWGRISPGIHWTWFQTHNMCLPHVDTCPLLTLLPNELQTSVRGPIGLEFCKESSGHSLSYLTCVLHRSNMWFTHAWVTFNPFELQTSLRGQNWVEFCQESSGHGPRHVTCALQGKGTGILCMTMLWSMRTVAGVLLKNMETISVKQTTIFTVKSYCPLKP